MRSGAFTTTAIVFVAAALLAAGCSGAAVPSPVASARPTPSVVPAASSPGRGPTPTLPASSASPPAWTDRPFQVFVPPTYDPAVPMPLVLLLHGYSSSGAQMEAAFHLQPAADQSGFLYAHPDGTTDATGAQFWNATDACCNADDSAVDDSAYLASVIDHVSARYNVDPRRIYLVGASNGGFMAYRMACDHADRVAAIVSVSGATFLDPRRCRPSGPVSVLEVHGTADEIVGYDGGQLIDGHPFPGAAATVAQWAAANGCSLRRTTVDAHLDLDASVPGSETTQSAFESCPADGAVALWTVAGAGHVLDATPALTDGIVRFLLSHPKR